MYILLSENDFVLSKGNSVLGAKIGFLIGLLHFI